MKRKVAALEKVDADHTSLQHKIRSDPQSYSDDFQAQYGHYQDLLGLFLISPTSTDAASLVRMRDLIELISQVADCYPVATTRFAPELMNLLQEHHATLEIELRDKIVNSVGLLRKKGIIDSKTLFNALWPLLLSTPSKSLRALLYQKIISDLRAANQKTKNYPLNRHVQAQCSNIIEVDPTKGLWAVKVTRELWKRQVWDDAHAVRIMEYAALSGDAKVVTSGIRFFLGGDKEREEAAEESEDEVDIDIGKLRHRAGITKKSAKKEQEIRAAVAKLKRNERKKNAPHPLNFSALHLLQNPQNFAEKLFRQYLEPAKPRVRLNLEQQLLVLNVVTRLVGLHELVLTPLYSYFLRFLTPKQSSVTSFLASLAQATHKTVPPDDLEPLVQKIANEFVSEASAGDVASAGLNAIREVCKRQPLAMNETLLQDLVQYRKSKDKGVQIAARGLLSLYREEAAEMLKKRDRGRDAALKIRSGEGGIRRFGQVEIGRIEGLDLLKKWKEEHGLLEEKGWEDWEVQSTSTESSGGWINVESDSEKEEKTGGEEYENEDKDDEDEEKEEQNEDDSAMLATKYILTPADFAIMKETSKAAAISSLPAAKRRRIQQKVHAAHADDGVTAADIEACKRLSHKASKEEKVAMAKGAGEAERNDHRSMTARRKEKKAMEGKSTTNKEKARRKNMLMTLGKAKKKGKRSLAQHGKILKAHLERKKRGGRRGNR
ncbi:SDA1 domain-containing protein [Piedraia hortae CBS 480.64]|uniref:Protein SDA1 n=1 Tax=Piedraia hortae CBS 480.64 TaxID=1314780 RepID=A0A6A7BZX5_9PEZI|nr:SDA1 domain-containing protein [Piedraia hortae CBS 480.64]